MNQGLFNSLMTDTMGVWNRGMPTERSSSPMAVQQQLEVLIPAGGLYFWWVFPRKKIGHVRWVKPPIDTNCRSTGMRGPGRGVATRGQRFSSPLPAWSRATVAWAQPTKKTAGQETRDGREWWIFNDLIVNNDWNMPFYHILPTKLGVEPSKMGIMGALESGIC